MLNYSYRNESERPTLEDERLKLRSKIGVDSSSEELCPVNLFASYRTWSSCTIHSNENSLSLTWIPTEVKKRKVSRGPYRVLQLRTPETGRVTRLLRKRSHTRDFLVFPLGAPLVDTDYTKCPRTVPVSDQNRRHLDSRQSVEYVKKTLSRHFLTRGLVISGHTPDRRTPSVTVSPVQPALAKYTFRGTFYVHRGLTTSKESDLSRTTRGRENEREIYIDIKKFDFDLTIDVSLSSRTCVCVVR